MTKMTDTPRTDTVEQVAIRCMNHAGALKSLVPLARTLECELNAVTKQRDELFKQLDDLLYCIEDFQLGDYSPLMDEVFDSRHALEESGIPRRRSPKSKGQT